MSHAARHNLLLALLFAAMTTAAATAPQRQIGSWILDCPTDKPGPCRMHLNQRLVDQAGITADLEVQAQGKTLVPVIAVHGLPSELLMQAAMLGHTEASLRFANGKREDLVCAATKDAYLCAPSDSAAQRLAVALPHAQTVTIRVSMVVDGLKPLPAQEKSLDLSGTTEALARLRSLGALQMPAPLPAPAVSSPARLMEMADKALKAAGYQNGVAGLQGLLAKYLQKQGAVR
jgi:hypothetical protein